MGTVIPEVDEGKCADDACRPDTGLAAHHGRWAFACEGSRQFTAKHGTFRIEMRLAKGVRLRNDSGVHGQHDIGYGLGAFGQEPL